MIELSPVQVTPPLRALLPSDAPAALRLTAVLAGLAPGKIFTDDADYPTWVVVQESFFGTLYLGGAPDQTLLIRLVNDLRKIGEVLYGFWDEHDPYIGLLPKTEYDGRVLEFTDRQANLTAYKPPDGLVIRAVDRTLFEQVEDYAGSTALYGSLEKAFENFHGFCLMHDDEILSEASAGVPINGIVEIGTNTRLPHRRKGYATIVCAHLIQERERQGYQTYWNCAKQNAASAALALRLGYKTEKEYRLYAWFPPTN